MYEPYRLSWIIWFYSVIMMDLEHIIFLSSQILNLFLMNVRRTLIFRLGLTKIHNLFQIQNRSLALACIFIGFIEKEK